MHIEPGVVIGAKIILSYASGAIGIGATTKLAFDAIRTEGGAARLAMRSAVTTGLVFSFFQLLPHFPVGVSEVHLILGSSLLLLFGAGPAAIGLVLGLLLQGLFFVPGDLPQYGMNVTTLLMSLFAVRVVAARVISSQTAYADLTYAQVAKMSVAFQLATVSWVGFWVLYGKGFSAQTFTDLATFGAAYMSVILIEPLIDLALLAIAKRLKGSPVEGLFTARLYQTKVIA